MFCNKAIFYGEELSAAPCPTPKLGDHPLSAVCDCLFNKFASTIHIGCCFSTCNLRMCHCCGDNVHNTLIWKYYSSIFVAWLVLWEVCFLVHNIIIVFDLHINGTQNCFKKYPPCLPLLLIRCNLGPRLHKEFVLFFHLYSFSVVCCRGSALLQEMTWIGLKLRFSWQSVPWFSFLSFDAC